MSEKLLAQDIPWGGLFGYGVRLGSIPGYGGGASAMKTSDAENPR